MAKVLGDSARYASQTAANKHERVLLHCMIMISVCAGVAGACAASFIPVAALPTWVRLLLPAVALIGVLLLKIWGDRRFRQLNQECKTWRSGASGEILVGNLLRNFPETYYVINDLKTEYGNLDHVVVGPTGVFVLDTKNCRGVVTADGRGELLINGRKPPKDYVRPLVRRMLGVRDKMRVLAEGCDPFYHAVLVFTAAWVDARWGFTGAANCVGDNQLYEYIVEKRVDKPLRNEEIKRLAQAFLSLAQMDEGFSPKPSASFTVRLPEKHRIMEAQNGNPIIASGECRAS